jgi:alcohol dehydrogenase (cytochrome c)
VFFEEESGAFVAANEQSGKVLWSFQANTPNWHASQMTYQFDGKQYIAIVSGGNVIALSTED